MDNFPGETDSGPAGGNSDRKPCTLTGDGDSLDGAADRFGGGGEDFAS